MSERLCTYLVEIAGQTLPVKAVHGVEAMSAPFRFEFTFATSETDPMLPDDLVRQPCSLVMDLAGEVRRVTGIVTDVSRKATRSGNAYKVEFRVVLEPTLALLRHRQDIRVFRNKTAPAIAAEVMRALGVKVEERLSSTYRVRPYTVQFRELDLDFAHRMLEDEGIHYFITEDDTVVFGDAASSYDGSVGLLPFRHDSGLATDGYPIVEIGSRGTMTPGKITLRDFNPVHPRLNMDVSAAGPTQGGVEYYDYPGEYEEPAEGQLKAKLRAEAWRCAHHRVAGKTFSAQMRPGALFETMNTPSAIHDGEFVTTRLEHDWKLADGAYKVKFESLPSKVTFRPPVVTPAPSQTNPLTGFVTGPAGADIHTNEWGQVKVHFPWDRLQPKDDNCSHWIPIMQDNTGHSVGISRTGWEVLCHYFEGDLDRPVVLGRVYNALDQFPSPLPVRKSRQSLRSLSSPRVHGEDTPANSIDLEDLAGFEAIMVHAQKDQNVIVKNDKKEQIDETEGAEILGNESITVGANQTIYTKTTMQPTVELNQTRSIGGNHDLKVGATMVESVTKNLSTKIGASHKRNIGARDSELVVKNTKERVGGVDIQLSIKTNVDEAEQTRTLLVGGAVVEVAKKNKLEQTGLGKIEAIGGVAFAKAGKTMHTRADKSRRTTVGGLLRIEAVKELLVAGLEKLTKKAQTATYEGTKTVTFKVGSTEINMKEGRIELNASQTIVIKTNSENKQGSSTSTQN